MDDAPAPHADADVSRWSLRPWVTAALLAPVTALLAPQVVWGYDLSWADDAAGQTIDILLRARRDANTAERCFPKALRAKHMAIPRVITIEKHAAYPPAGEALQQEGQLPAHYTLLRESTLHLEYGLQSLSSLTLPKGGPYADTAREARVDPRTPDPQDVLLHRWVRPI